MAFRQCLEYASSRYREITGESRGPSHGDYPGDYWNNATNTTKGIIAPGVAIWINNENTNRGHALCIERYDYATGKYFISEANWDDNGKVRNLTMAASDIKEMYTEKVWKGTVY